MKIPTPDDLVVIAEMAKMAISYAEEPGDIHLEFTPNHEMGNGYTYIDIMGEVQTAAVARLGVCLNQMSRNNDVGWSFNNQTPGWFNLEICACVGPINDEFLLNGAAFVYDRRRLLAKPPYDDELNMPEQVRGLRQMAEYVRRRACIASPK